jgi:predicted GIY-YIG superfamily endonuclease
MAETEDQPLEGAKFYYVYILRCNDNNLYTGCTHNLKQRLERHQKGWVSATKERRPVRLLWCCAFPERLKAFEFEQYLKSGSGRAFAKKHFYLVGPEAQQK